MNPFEDYSDLYDHNTDLENNYSLPKSQKNLKTLSHNDIYSPSDIDAMLKKKFQASLYPTDLTTENIFCPICGKEVRNSESSRTYQSILYRRKFLAHTSCLNQEVSIFLSDQYDHIEEMKTSPWSYQGTKAKALFIGDREFCIQLFISHPLSDFKFIKLINKGLLNDGTIRWDLRQEYETNCYIPNMICFPFVDFKVVLTLSQIGSGENKKSITQYVNLTRNKNLKMPSLRAKCDEFTLQILIHSTPDQKNTAIDKMNYKYRYREGLNLPIIELLSIQITVPEQPQGEQFEQNSSSIVRTLLQNDEVSSYVSYGSMHSGFSGHYGTKQQMRKNSSPEKGSQKNYLNEKQKFDLEALVATNKLSAYVRNNVQSRIFQNFLDQANNQQVQLIIKSLYEELTDLITDQYANYMTQKLFQVCLPSQRISILSKLFDDIPNLVRNKQGTHTIQHFICLLTLDEQYALVCKSIQKDFESLCFHSIAAHFTRKIIHKFPLKHTIEFFHIVNKNFLKFAVDKNAMCIIKQMVIKLKQLQDNPLTFEIKKHFINSITFNTDKIIQDCFGNYVVQFSYQYFGETKSSGITEMIIEKFVQFSIQKYSSSVISKCINTYWTEKSCLIRLKDSLKPQGIIEIYRNRYGNKILLDIMDKHENTPIRDRIYNVIASSGEAAKFYHDRWGFQIGIRSGPAGMQAKSFGQAQRMLRNPKQNSKKSKKK